LIKKKDDIIFELNKKIKLLEKQLKTKKDKIKNNLDNNSFKISLITPIHNLNFSIFSIPKRKKDDQPKNKNEVEEVNKEYNYEILSIEEISSPKEVEEEDEAVLFKFFVKNNKKLPWLENKTKFILDNKSSIKSIKNKNIILMPLKINQYQQIEIEFDLKNINPGEYKCIFDFNVDGQNYGNPLVLTIKIKEGKISEFRKIFGLATVDYKKEVLNKVLKINGYDMDKAFSSLFD